MGDFWGIPAPIMGTILEILLKLGVKNGYFPSKWPNLAIMGGLRKFCTYDGCFFHDSPQRVLMLRAAHPLQFPEWVPLPPR